MFESWNYSSTWSGTHGPTNSEYQSHLLPGVFHRHAGGWGEMGWEDLLNSNSVTHVMAKDTGILVKKSQVIAFQLAGIKNGKD